MKNTKSIWLVPAKNDLSAFEKTQSILEYLQILAAKRTPHGPPPEFRVYVKIPDEELQVRCLNYMRDQNWSVSREDPYNANSAAVIRVQTEDYDSVPKDQRISTE